MSTGIVARCYPVPAKGAAHEREVGLEVQAQRSQTIAARSNSGITTDPLRDKGPVRLQLHAHPGAVEAGEPGVLEAIGGSGIAAVVVMQRAHHESFRPRGLHADVVAGTIIDLMEEFHLVA